MATIVSIRHYKPGHQVLWDWISQNVNGSDYIMDRISITFWNDSDATMFCMVFGISNATYRPELLNRIYD